MSLVFWQLGAGNQEMTRQTTVNVKTCPYPVLAFCRSKERPSCMGSSEVQEGVGLGAGLEEDARSTGTGRDGLA